MPASSGMLSNAWIGVGVVLVLIGPLLNVPIVWALSKFVTRLLGTKWTALAEGPGPWLVAALAWGVVLFASWLPGSRAFEAACEEHGPPKIHRRAPSKGLVRTKLFMYGTHDYLQRDGFRFVEAPNPYRKGEWLRYTWDGTRVHDTVIEGPTAPYASDHSLEERWWGTLSRKRITERSTGEEIAVATMTRYSGGPLAFLLGVGSGRDCPDIRTEEGSKNFDLYYRLDKHTLGVNDASSDH